MKVKSLINIITRIIILIIPLFISCINNGNKTLIESSPLHASMPNPAPPPPTPETESKYAAKASAMLVFEYKYEEMATALKAAISKSTKSEKYKKKYKEYEVVLGADPTIIMPGPPGRLKVWIGIPDYKPNFPKGMTQASGALPALGATAKITPFAPAFKVEPKESICVQIDPTGSEVSFTLTPTKGGTFEVGSDVRLYGSINCSGTPIPKGTTTLQVQVVVKRTDPFCDVFWEKLLKFWGEILVLFFAVILFLIRKQLMKWIGFGKDK